MITLCFVSIHRLPSDRARAEQLASALPFGQAEVERLHRIAHTQRFYQSLGGLLALQRLTEARTPSVPLTIGRETNGKPFFLHSSLPPFSIAHAGDWAVAAMGEDADGAIGVDLEWVRTDRNLPRIVRRFFSQEEQARWQASPRHAEDFYRLWTQKEACAKLTGQGIFSHDGNMPTEIPYQRSFRIRYGTQVAYCTVACRAPTERICVMDSKEELQIDEFSN